MQEKNAALCRDAATPVTAGTEAKAQRSTTERGGREVDYFLNNKRPRINVATPTKP